LFTSFTTGESATRLEMSSSSMAVSSSSVIMDSNTSSPTRMFSLGMSSPGSSYFSTMLFWSRETSASVSG